jgi:hypothetical protein
MNQVVSEAGLESLQYAHSTCSLSKRLVALILRIELESHPKISLAESVLNPDSLVLSSLPYTLKAAAKTRSSRG